MIDTSISVIAVSLTTWKAHHSPRTSPSGCGELPRSLMRQQWHQYWYQFLYLIISTDSPCLFTLPLISRICYRSAQKENPCVIELKLARFVLNEDPHTWSICGHTFFWPLTKHTFLDTPSWTLTSCVCVYIVGLRNLERFGHTMLIFYCLLGYDLSEYFII